MRKKQIISIIFLSCILYNAVAISHGEKYFCTEKWNSGYEISGEIRTQLTILKICNSSIVIFLEKDMTPFLETLNVTVEAVYEKDKYVFHGFDNWGNEVFGYFTIDASEADEKIIIFFDVKEFSDIGNNIARLYGATSILSKGSIMF